MLLKPMRKSKDEKHEGPLALEDSASQSSRAAAKAVAKAKPMVKKRARSSSSSSSSSTNKSTTKAALRAERSGLLLATQTAQDIEEENE